MIKEWFSLISVILVITFINLIFTFQFDNILHWIYLISLTIAILMTVFVYLEQPHKKDVNILKKTYSDFLKEKDSKIDKLKQETDLMFKTAAKRAEKDIELEELKRKLEEKTNN